MNLSVKALADDLCHPCYLRKRICTREVLPGSYLLIAGEDSRIFLLVKECFAEEHSNPFLKVDVLGYRNCTLPSQNIDIFMCGADPNPKADQGRVIYIPFIQTGYAIFLSERHISSSEVSGLYYTIGQLFMFGPSLIQ